MPTKNRHEALTLEGVRERLRRAGFPRDAGEPDRTAVGLEPEMFAYRLLDGARPGARLPLSVPSRSDRRTVLGVLDELAPHEPWLAPRAPGATTPVYELTHGGSLTFEPGGQVEHSTAVHATCADAVRDLDAVRQVLCSAFRANGVVLAKFGLDPWSAVDDVPQQLDAPRYRAMASYFAKRGPAGAMMMRMTASMQVNLDLGARGVAEERWRVVNLASPFVTATFAASPTADDVCGRARIWQELDPTRSGFPPRFVDGPGDEPYEELLAAALAADVMLLRDADGGATPGEPGFTFERWLREGHPELGWPTADDFDYHRTTLFFEVRCRGFLELRACDALPEPWHSVPAVLLCSLVYDGEARRDAIELLEPLRPRLPELWRDAARDGVRAPALAERTVALWRIALAGARRLGPGYLPPNGIATAQAFLERFTESGRMPSDELREALAESPERALAWSLGDAPCPERVRGVGA